MTDTDFDPSKIEELIRKIAPLLSGHGSSIQGAVIADLTALWLAGHVVRGEPTTSANTKHMRALVRKNHNDLIDSLIPVNDELLKEAQDEAQARITTKIQ